MIWSRSLEAILRQSISPHDTVRSLNLMKVSIKSRETAL